jgi:YidC/Oxa1 family membrane protein insertase
MDWKTWVAVGLSIVGLIVWQFYYANQVVRPPVPQEASQPLAEPASPADSSAQPPTTTRPGSTAGGATGERTPSTTEPAMISRRESVQTADAEYIFNNDTGGIEEVLLLLHLGENRESVFLNRDRQMPIGALCEQPETAIGGFEMMVNRKAGSVVFEKVEADGMKITKEFRLPQEEDATRRYLLDLNVSFENTSSTELQRLGYFVSTGGAAPVHARDMPLYTRFDWFRDGKMTSIDVNWFPSWRIPLVGIETRGDRPVYLELRDSISWAAVTSQYFVTLVRMKNANGISVWATRFETDMKNGGPVYGIRGALGLEGFRLAPGESRQLEFEIFAGPKDFEILRKLGHGERDVMRFGMFGIVSEFLLWGMSRLYSLTGNYGLAIVLLTLIIKTLLWPVQNKSTQSMRKMALLSPKMQELRTKYKDNPQKMNEELMKLYKEYRVNPFGGCLPLLIQIPIFFGFYSMLGVSIQLRNASFLWIPDLSQPDTIATIAGFPVNLLPLIMTGTMVWQIAITPKTGDAMQQRIFYFMPVIFLVFCYNFASALALYWTTQNLFSIVQLYLTRNQPLPTLEKRSDVEKRERQAARKKKRKRTP